ncbi:MAG TPA: hypothetical protein VM848_06640 [Acidimicrobiia bacterium]|nr:hypothetical protein [Acidimicrobiia bacterium]
MLDDFVGLELEGAQRRAVTDDAVGQRQKGDLIGDVGRTEANGDALGPSLR